MYKFTKNNINKFISEETNKRYNLNEDVYVEPSKSSSSSDSLSSDLSKAKSENPTKNEFTVDGNSYDGNSSNNAVTIDVQGKNAQDAANNMKNLQQNPNVKNIKNKNFRFHLESYIPFSKKEINEMLKK